MLKLLVLVLLSCKSFQITKDFSNNSSTDIKLKKQSGGLLGRLLGPLLKAGVPLMEKVIKPLAKSVLIPLGLTVAGLAADAGIHKKKF